MSFCMHTDDVTCDRCRPYARKVHPMKPDDFRLWQRRWAEELLRAAGRERAEEAYEHGAGI